MHTTKFSREHWPQEWQQGMIKTKNTMGVMLNTLSPASKAFVELAKSTDANLLDIGSAYGIATYPALESGATVTACDMSGEHLKILREGVPESHQLKLTTAQGIFPKDFIFEPDTFTGINISMLLHFLDDEETIEGLQKCHDWLQENGKLFIVVVTPYVTNLSSLAPRFEERLANNEDWPGVFHLDNKKDVDPEWADHLPPFIHVFNTDTLRETVSQAGFTVESCEYFTFDNIPDDLHSNGKGFISLIASK